MTGTAYHYHLKSENKISWETSISSIGIVLGDQDTIVEPAPKRKRESEYEHVKDVWRIALYRKKALEHSKTAILPQ